MLMITAICCLLVGDSRIAATDSITTMVARKLEVSNSYHLRLRIEMQNRTGPDSGRNAYTAEVWRLQDKFRFDITDAASDPSPPAGHNQPGGAGTRDVTCQNCERPGHVIITRVSPGKPAITQLVAFDTSPALSGHFEVLNIDWRFFGLSGNSLASYSKTSVTEYYRKFVANPKLSTSRHDRIGKSCLLASLKSADNEFDTYFSEAEQCHPVLYSVVNGTAESQIKITTEVGWQRAAGGHLYPSRVAHALTVGGKAQYDEVITVLHADFHNAVDPAVFTLAGLNLNEDQQIAYPGVPPGDWPRWRDGKVDPSLSYRAVAEAAAVAHPAEVLVPIAPYPGGDTGLLYAGVGSGVVAVVALAGALVYRRRRRGD